MGMGDRRNLEYDGLLLELCKPDGANDYHVWRIEVTGSQWRLTPGLRIGMSRARVVAVLGEPESITADGGTSTLHYSLYSCDGWLWAEIVGDKLTKVGLSEDWS